jgi:hypothetical protein
MFLIQYSIKDVLADRAGGLCPMFAPLLLVRQFNSRVARRFRYDKLSSIMFGLDATPNLLRIPERYILGEY